MKAMRAVIMYSSWLLWTLCSMGCGDRLASANYRGEALFSVSGSVQPAPEYDDSQFVCSNQEWECVDRCYLEYEDLNEFDDFEPDVEEVDRCIDQCAQSVDECLKSTSSGVGFNEVYYGNISQQRIAIIWANPIHVGRSDSQSSGLLQQRSVTATEFPARYTFSIFQPPPDSAYFGRDSSRYAFGVIVTYFDKDGDAVLDVDREPIIGFTSESGVLYAPQAIEHAEGVTLQKGYHLYPGNQECADAEFLQLEPPDENENSTPLVISGTTSFIFNNLPDVGCDGSQEEWLDLCESASQRARCSRESTSELYQPICDFCARRSVTVNGGTMLPQESDETPDMDSDNSEPDEPECLDEDPNSRARCEAEREYADCRDRAATPEDEQACDETLEERQRNLD